MIDLVYPYRCDRLCFQAPNRGFLMDVCFSKKMSFACRPNMAIDDLPRSTGPLSKSVVWFITAVPTACTAARASNNAAPTFDGSVSEFWVIVVPSLIFFCPEKAIGVVHVPLSALSCTDSESTSEGAWMSV